MKYLSVLMLALAAEQVASHAVLPGRAVAASSFLTRILEKTGLGDAEVAQMETLVKDHKQASGSGKRSIATSSLISSILAKTGLSDEQTAHVKDLMEQHIQENESKAHSATMKRSSDNFLTRLLQRIGLNEPEVHQVQQLYRSIMLSTRKLSEPIFSMAHPSK